jgi:hypothetical protein
MFVWTGNRNRGARPMRGQVTSGPELCQALHVIRRGQSSDPFRAEDALDRGRGNRRQSSSPLSVIIIVGAQFNKPHTLHQSFLSPTIELWCEFALSAGFFLPYYSQLLQTVNMRRLVVSYPLGCPKHMWTNLSCLGFTQCASRDISHEFVSLGSSGHTLFSLYSFLAPSFRLQLPYASPELAEQPSLI